MQKKLRVNNSENRCKTCNEIIYGKYCHNCGEKKLSREDFTVKNFIEQAVDVFTHFDSKIIKSAYLLVIKPGFVTSEYLAGRRVKYAKPVQLFFVLNIIYFVILNYAGYDTVTNPLTDHMTNPFYGQIATSMVSNKIAEQNISFEKYDNKFYDVVYVHSRVLLILMIPLFALVLKVIYIRQDRLYYEHLVFSTYFFCFVLIFYSFFLNILYYSVYFLTEYDLKFNSIIDIDDTTAAFIYLFLFAVYLYISLKQVYKNSTGQTFLETLLAMLGLTAVVTIYNFILFLTVFIFT